MFLRAQTSLTQLVRINLNELLTQSKCLRRPVTSSQTKFSCWKCGAEKSSAEGFFCSKCSALQGPDGGNSYFDVLGVEKKFDLKAAELTKKFRHLQSVLHPDKFGGKDENELAHSLNHSAVLNQAYSTLLKPLERGLYLLKLSGITIEEGSVDMDPMFLMEIMELNEKLEETKDANKLEKFAESNTKVINQYIRDLDVAFGSNDLQKAKQLIVKLKYYSSLDEKIKEVKRESGIAS